MKNVFYFLLFVLLNAGISSAQPAAVVADVSSEIVKIEAQPDKGFAYPYYLYVPKVMREEAAGGRKKTRALLVIPNNAGKTRDDFNVHEEDVKRRIKNNAQIAARLGVALLTPVFPRPQTDWQIYTHALDRDAMTT
ncbi:MAG TPA: hypothetical protein VK400_00235, partial [Pyrinomonadaceae bacterium]|nr:hypothetical protein [Pyrinomonadaceae bacterium]